MTRTFYTALLYVLIIFTPFKLLWRARNQSEYLQHWQERYGFYSDQPQKPIIWLHCVSVGETRAAAPLVEALMLQHPSYQILLTHTTPTGRTTAKLLFGNRIKSVYLPYDVPFAVNKFLAHFKPTIGMLMETELWFNLIAACKARGIPLLLINARLSEKSARGYDKLGQLVHEGLTNLTHVAAQTHQDAERLAKLGATNVSVMGNIKFDVMPPPNAAMDAQKLRYILHGKEGGVINKTPRPIFLAASTRDLNGVDEEALVLQAVAKAAIPNLLTVIVPRHPQRFHDVEKLLQTHKLRYLKRSELQTANAEAISQMQVLLGDSMGEMFMYYALCDVAFIGGSLVALGGQNIIEACAMAKPTLVGPHTFNFSQVVARALLQGACLRVNNIDELAAKLKALFENSQAQQQMQQSALAFRQLNQGATLRIMELLNHHLK